MAETREITLTERNWQKIKKLLDRILNSVFLRFCLMNDIVEARKEILKEQITRDK